MHKVSGFDTFSTVVGVDPTLKQDPERLFEHVKNKLLTPVATNYYQKTAKIQECDQLIQEALTHIECYRRIGDLTTRPLELGRVGDSLIFRTMRVNGLTAFKYIQQHEEDTREVVIKIMHAIIYMQQKGISHRDLHTNNVMVYKNDDNAPVVKIIDFGFTIIKEFHNYASVYNELHSHWHNPSADVCIFMRSMALSLHNPYHMFLDVYDKIMRAYERECADLLQHQQKPVFWEKHVPYCVNLRHREALIGLYKISNEWADSGKLDYYLSHFDWETMHPGNIITMIRNYYV